MIFYASQFPDIGKLAFYLNTVVINYNHVKDRHPAMLRDFVNVSSIYLTDPATLRDDR